jgi:hypothetical protein
MIIKNWIRHKFKLLHSVRFNLLDSIQVKLFLFCFIHPTRCLEVRLEIYLCQNYANLSCSYICAELLSRPWGPT